MAIELVANRQSRSLSVLYLLSLSMVFLLALCSFFSPLRAVPNFNLVWAAGMIAWFALTLADNWSRRLGATSYQLLIFFFIAYTVAIAYACGNGVIGNRFFELAQVLLFYMAYEKSVAVGRERDSRRLIISLVPFMLANALMTLNAYRTDIWASRTAGLEAGFRSESLRAGIGGYELIYFLVIMCAVLLFTIFRKGVVQKPLSRIPGTVLFLTFAATVILSNFSTALAVLVMVVVVRGLMFPMRVKYAPVFMVAVVLVCYAASAVFFELLQFLVIRLGDSSLNAMRLAELLQAHASQGVGESTQARLDVFWSSIVAFMGSPILGIVVERIEYSGEFLTGFGQHSQVLDTFALYGIGIGVLQLYLYLRPFAARFRTADGFTSPMATAVLLAVVIIVSVDNATPSIGFAAFYVFPAAYDWLHGQNVRESCRHLVFRRRS